MGRGKIEQIGDPQEIYRAPRTKFVAEFLGSSNIFSGRVAALADGLVEIATPAGDFEVVRNPAKDLARDDATTFVVSGDRIQLTKDQPAAGLNRMEAVVGIGGASCRERECKSVYI